MQIFFFFLGRASVEGGREKQTMEGIRRKKCTRRPTAASGGEEFSWKKRSEKQPAKGPVSGGGQQQVRSQRRIKGGRSLKAEIIASIA